MDYLKRAQANLDELTAEAKKTFGERVTKAHEEEEKGTGGKKKDPLTMPEPSPEILAASGLVKKAMAMAALGVTDADLAALSTPAPPTKEPAKKSKKK